MNEQRFPAGWDEVRVKRLLSHYEQLTEEQKVVEDEEAAQEQSGTAVIAVPEDLLPATRELIATLGSA
ncbi:MAG: hypothetical protein AB7U20_06375 [Planctomycetaceae bacterium]